MDPSLPGMSRSPSAPTVWVASLAATAFGNSLEPVPALALAQPLLLLLAYRGVPKGGWCPLATFATALLHAVAWTVAFGGLFNVDGRSASGLATVFALGLLLWTLLCFGALMGSSKFRARYPESRLGALVFPCAWTAVYFVVGLTPLSTMANPAYSLLDLRPFALAASLCGIHGLNFFLALAATAVESLVGCGNGGPGSENRNDGATAGTPGTAGSRAAWIGAAVFALACYGSFWGHIDTFYQRGIEETASRRAISASCVLGPGSGEAQEREAWMMQQTRQRVLAGDDIILWSEAALAVEGPEDEARLLRRASSALLLRVPPRNAQGPYLGITYFQAEDKKNMFVLLGPDGEPRWRYQKAHPVPFQMDGAPGEAILPTTDAAAIGRLGGAICFDMDFPSFLRQAGPAGVDILLQPSNTWGPIGDYHFRGNALRAVENGFVHVRCSSGGYSGVADPFYSFVHRTATLRNATSVFTVPVRRRVRTPYSALGPLLEWTAVAATAVFLALALLPASLLRRLLPEPHQDGALWTEGTAPSEQQQGLLG